MADVLWTGKNSDKLYEQSSDFTSTVKQSLSVSSLTSEPTDISPNEDDIVMSDHTYEKTFFLSSKFTTTVKQSLDHSAYLYSAQGGSCDQVNTLVVGDGAVDVTDNEMYLFSGKITSTVKSSLNVGVTHGTPYGCTNDGVDTTWTINNKFLLSSGQITSTVKDSFTYGSSDREGIGWDGISNTLSCGYSNDKLTKYSGRFTSTIRDSEYIAAKDGSSEGIEYSAYDLRVGIGNFGTITLPMLGVTSMNVIVLPLLTVFATDYAAYSLLDLPIFTFNTWMQTTNDGDIALPVLGVSSIANPGNNTIDITFPSMVVYSEQVLRANGNVILPMLSIDTVVQQGSVEGLSLTMPMLTLSAFSGQVVTLTLPSFSLYAVGQSGIRGLYDKSLPRLQVVGYGTLHQHGNANVRIPLFSLQTNLINGIISISTDIVLPVLMTNFHGFRGENGNADITFPMIETATNVALNPNGDVSLTLFALKLDAYADVYINRFI
jgi:hypothetical protein